MKEHKLDFIHLFCYRSSGPVSFGYSELENNTQQASILSADIAAQTTPGIERAPFSIKNELKVSSIMIMKKFELANKLIIEKHTSLYYCRFFLFQSLSAEENANKKQMLDKGQNTNDDYKIQVSDSSTKNETITSKENSKLKNSISSTSATNALSPSSSENITVENICTSSKQQLSNNDSSCSSALSEKSKLTIISMSHKD